MFQNWKSSGSGAPNSDDPESRQIVCVNEAVDVWKETVWLSRSASHLPTLQSALEAEQNLPKKSYHKSAVLMTTHTGLSLRQIIRSE